MSNPLGRFLDREAQNFTAEIDSATEVRDDTMENVSPAVDASSIESAESMWGAGEKSLANGAAVLKTTRDGDLAKQVMSEFDGVGNDSLGSLSGEDEILGGGSDIIPESPEVVSEELAHERKLARDEGDVLEAREFPKNQETGLAQENREAQEFQETRELQGAQELQGIQDTEETGGTQESLEAQGEWREREVLEEQEGRERQGEQSDQEPLYSQEPIRSAVQETGSRVSSVVDSQFVGGEKELAKGTMELVEHTIAGRGETSIVDILRLYEQGAHAMREDDERVG